MTRKLTAVVGSLLTLAACGLGDVGDSPAGGTATSIPLAMYQGEHAVAHVDSNGGLYNNITPRQFEAYGGSPQSGYSWTITTGTSLPFPGLLIDPLTGVVRGTIPSGIAAGSYPFSVTVSDGSTTYTSGSGGTIQSSITVFACNSKTAGAPDPSNCSSPGPLTAGGGTSTNINALVGTVSAGKPFGFSLSVGGGTPPYKSWGVKTGTLPPGLTLDQSRGVLYGTPFSSAAGTTYTFAITVADSAGHTFPGASDSPATYKIAIQ